jgi:hypothetical protein
VVPFPAGDILFSKVFERGYGDHPASLSVGTGGGGGLLPGGLSHPGTES